MRNTEMHPENKELTGKRLLILGGTTLMINVVKTARKMGVYTVVTDRDPRSPAKQFADRAYDVSTGEMDALVQVAREEHIDGVFAGYDDFNTTVAVQLSQILGLRYYATQEQIDITKSKIDFKNLCKKYGVPTVKEYSLENISFPCVVKPSDSYSAKGITICYEGAELAPAIEHALRFSASKSYLIEKYMSPDRCDCVNIDYVLRDGEIYLSAVGDKKVLRQGNYAPLTSAVVYPSAHYDRYAEEVDAHVKEMFRSIGMKDGVVFIESFFDEDGFAIYEMGYRVGGGQSSILTKHVFGLDYVDCLIRFALTGSMCGEEACRLIEPSFGGKTACGLVILSKTGTVARISGLEEIGNMADVINITQYLHEGDTVPENLAGTLGQTFARIHIVSDSRKAFEKTLEAIQNTLRVTDQEGGSMILDTFNTI